MRSFEHNDFTESSPLIRLGAYEIDDQSFFSRLVDLLGNERTEYRHALAIGLLLCFDYGVVVFVYYFPAGFYQSFMDYTDYTDAEYNMLFALSAVAAGFGPVMFAQSCQKGSIMRMKFYLILGVALCQIMITFSVWYDYIYIHYICRLLVGACAGTIISLVFTCLADWFPQQSATAMSLANGVLLTTLGCMYYSAVFLASIPDSILPVGLIGICLTFMSIISARYQDVIDEDFLSTMPLLLQSGAQKVSNQSLSDVWHIGYPGFVLIVVSSLGFISIAIFRTLGPKIMVDRGYFSASDAATSLALAMFFSIPVSFCAGQIIDFLGNRLLVTCGCICLHMCQLSILCFFKVPWLRYWMISINSSIADTIFIAAIYSTPVVFCKSHLQPLVYTLMNAVLYFLWSILVPLFDILYNSSPQIAATLILVIQITAIAFCISLWTGTKDALRKESERTRKASDDRFRRSVLQEWTEFEESSSPGTLTRGNSLTLFIQHASSLESPVPEIQHAQSLPVKSWASATSFHRARQHAKRA